MKDLIIQVTEVLELSKYSHREVADMFGMTIDQVQKIDEKRIMIEDECNGGF